jgi:hypothetical protein
MVFTTKGTKVKNKNSLFVMSKINVIVAVSPHRRPKTGSEALFTVALMQ